MQEHDRCAMCKLDQKRPGLPYCAKCYLKKFKMDEMDSILVKPLEKEVMRPCLVCGKMRLSTKGIRLHDRCRRDWEATTHCVSGGRGRSEDD